MLRGGELMDQEKLDDIFDQMLKLNESEKGSIISKIYGFAIHCLKYDKQIDPKVVIDVVKDVVKEKEV